MGCAQSWSGRILLAVTRSSVSIPRGIVVEEAAGPCVIKDSSVHLRLGCHSSAPGRGCGNGHRSGTASALNCGCCRLLGQESSSCWSLPQGICCNFLRTAAVATQSCRGSGCKTGARSEGTTRSARRGRGRAAARLRNSRGTGTPLPVLCLRKLLIGPPDLVLEFLVLACELTNLSLQAVNRPLPSLLLVPCLLFQLFCALL
mmetsp:Transcript_44823/g.103553  ORF Transcript_44823/g.103553 Transcript_44823/m.103553 type:complete len:202 (+) Transcript_44823:624-1229(+)